MIGSWPAAQFAETRRPWTVAFAGGRNEEIDMEYADLAVHWVCIFAVIGIISVTGKRKSSDEFLEDQRRAGS